MKTLRYLLIVMSLVSVLSVSAHMFDKQWGQKPVIEMRSTSAMAYSGSTLPQAAATGTVLTSETPGSYSQIRLHGGQPRRSRPGDNEDPYKDPLGDVLWPLICLALAYGVYLKCRKKKESYN